ncbi:MAG: NAD(P)-binding protein [Roseivirga sp.]|nr:NAD(P)-binding protein [Roseivirga sp.]
MNRSDVLIVGSGMGGLSAGALLAEKGLRVTVLEQNWQPGGCTSSYRRKGFVFEAGATTLVGLGDHMPLQHVLDKTGIELPVRRLSLPMQVHLADGATINRYENLNEWIAEAEKVFGAKGQRVFWKEAYKISQFVWKTSLKQTAFPPGKPGDLWYSLKNVSLDQIRNLPYAFISTEKLLEKHGLLDNEAFVAFVNEQLLITAQNHMSEVNALFGATALCYTNYPNYYLDGGLLNLVRPFVKYIEDRGGQVVLRESVNKIERNAEGYGLTCVKGQEYEAEYLISGIPINNTLEMMSEESKQHLQDKVMESEQLNSAFQLGIGFKPHKEFDTIHHQVHLDSPLVETGSASLFISLSHPQDDQRSDKPGMMVMSVSTHVSDPLNKMINSERTEKAVIDVLISKGFLRQEDIAYQHSSAPKSWAKWTGRKWGFVGGYPQYMSIKPWQMLDARLDKHKAYLVGDTVYPGQGIPGVTLSGIIAVEKMSWDWGL